MEKNMINNQARASLIQLLGRKRYSESMEDRISYSYDATRQRKIPDAVVFPENVTEVSKIMKIATAHRIPVVPRGSGSGLTGGTLPVKGGIIMVMNHFNHIVEIDQENLLVIVEPAVINAELQREVEKVGLFYPPDPASMDFCSIGGNIAENAGGMKAVKYGVTRDYVMGLEVVLPDGQIVHTGSKCIKDVVGYNLTQVFVGSEGTLGIITQAILRLLPQPESKKTMTAAFESMTIASKTVSDIIKNRIIPTTIEFMDRNAIHAVESKFHLGLPKGIGALLLIEVDGDMDQIDKQARQIHEVCRSNQTIEFRTAKTDSEREELWKARRTIPASMLKIKPLRLNEDIVVPRARLPEIIEAINRIAEKYNLIIVNFGHAGDGNVHVNVLMEDEAEEIKRAHHAVEDIFVATIALEGRISGEHGIGVTKREFIGLELGPAELFLSAQLKRLLDPGNILNPGKIFPDELLSRNKK